MSTHKLRPAILIISDTAAQDPTSDKAFATLSDVFSNHSSAARWSTPEKSIVPDDVLAIQRAIMHWCDDGGDDSVNLIVTTGGLALRLRIIRRRPSRR